MLNSLIGTNDLRNGVETIWQRDRTAFNVLDILIAVRDGHKKPVIDANGCVIDMGSLFESIEGVMQFLENTGLARLFKNGEITNLVDYVFGIETGLDSNARKNRGGHAMEHTISRILNSYSIPFRQEVYSEEWPAIKTALGDDKKRFDFVFCHDDITFLLEVNFYSSGGSKLNEVARAYSELAPKINAVKGFEFVWVTDGVGWHEAKNKLQEAYKAIPRVYNLTTIHNFIKELLAKQ